LHRYSSSSASAKPSPPAGSSPWTTRAADQQSNDQTAGCTDQRGDIFPGSHRTWIQRHAPSPGPLSWAHGAWRKRALIFS
jgi:hypothetical protein